MNEAILTVWLALLAAGLAVWVFAVRRMARGTPILPRAAAQNPRWTPGTVGVVLLWIGWQLFNRVKAELEAVADDAAAQHVGLETVQTSVLFNALLVGMLLLLVSEAGRRRLRPYGIHGEEPGRNALAGLLGFLASLPPVVLVLQLTAPLRPAEQFHPFVRIVQEQPSVEVIVWVTVAVVVAAPLAEELVFRVILQGALRSRLSAGWSIAASSVLFAGVHGFPDSLALLPLAVVLGYVFEQRRSYLAVVLLHALFNLRTLLVVLGS